MHLFIKTVPKIRVKATYHFRVSLNLSHPILNIKVEKEEIL